MDRDGRAWMLEVGRLLRENDWLRRQIQWCRPRLKNAGYQDQLDERLKAGPVEPDETRVIHSDAAVPQPCPICGSPLKWDPDAVMCTGEVGLWRCDGNSVLTRSER